MRVIEKRLMIAALGACAFIQIGPVMAQAGQSDVTAAIQRGSATFAQHCSHCHGVKAVNKGHVWPDLLRSDRYCDRLPKGAEKDMCMADGEAFFVRSVQEGKIRVGIVHMPAWKEVLSMNEILDIRRYLENRKELIAASRAR